MSDLVRLDQETKKDLVPEEKKSIFSEAKVPVAKTQAEESSEVVGNMVKDLVSQAAVHTVQTDENVRDDIIKTARKVVVDKTDAIKQQADKESKASFFDNNYDACQIFGYEEKTTAKVHVKIMAAWVFFLNTLYIVTLGFFLIAPVTFIGKKLSVVIKNVWIAALLALLIYAAIVATPFLVGLLSGAGAN